MPMRLGISGTGYIARSLFRLLAQMPDRYRITGVLSRRPGGYDIYLPAGLKRVQSADELCESCDIVVECSGHVAEAAKLVEVAFAHGRPVVTLNAEFHATLGVAFAGRGTLIEAQGDQPGSIAALAHEARTMGFVPLVYGSQKGFLNHTPDLADMKRWAKRQGISLAAVTAFTDGTKLQIEHALVANAMGATVTQRGLLGPRCHAVQPGVDILCAAAEKTGTPISDYVLVPGGTGEVFVAAYHPSPAAELTYYKLGDGPIYLLRRPYHLGHFELPLTLSHLVYGHPPLLAAVAQNTISVVAIAKRAITAGHHIPRAIGSFDFRGEAIIADEAPGHVPIGLMENCYVKRSLKAGETVKIEDIEFESEYAMHLWTATQPDVLTSVDACVK